jgi:hypothetical protein
MTAPGTWKQLPRLALAGGLAFWVSNLAISLTPIAAEYRAGLSIPYWPMLAEALLGGLAIGVGVSLCLLRFPDAIPGTTPVLKSGWMSLAALLLVTVLVEVPAKLLLPSSDPTRYLLIGLGFNLVRILALGVVIGLLHARVLARRTAS